MSVGAFIFTTIEHRIIDREISRLRDSSSTNISNMQGILLLNAQAKSVISLYPLKKVPDEKLSLILSLITPGIKVTHVEYDDGLLQFKLTGIAETRESLLNLKDSLEQTKEFTNINLPLVSLESSVQVPFILTFVQINKYAKKKTDFTKPQYFYIMFDFGFFIFNRLFIYIFSQ